MGLVTAQDFIPSRPTLHKLAVAAQTCQGCALYKDATQAVFGAGPRHAQVLLVGEQPGDAEDLAGLPFVGPAGKLLDKALYECGIGRETAYVTNAVKHFKWELRGKRRLHRRPSSAEIAACNPWLREEIKLVKTKAIVCLGVSAALAVLGKAIVLKNTRGKFIVSPFSQQTLVTVHPSSILRAPTDEERTKAYRQFVKELSLLTKLIR